MIRYFIFFASIAFTATIYAQSGLKNVVWVLSKVEDKKTNTNITLTHDHSILRFDDSTYAGYGCNAFSGKYRVSGDKLSFFGGMQISDQTCTQPDDAKVEDYIMKDFVQLQFKLIGETLILSKNNDVFFTFKKKVN